MVAWVGKASTGSKGPRTREIMSPKSLPEKLNPGQTGS